MLTLLVKKTDLFEDFIFNISLLSTMYKFIFSFEFLNALRLGLILDLLAKIAVIASVVLIYVAYKELKHREKHQFNETVADQVKLFRIEVIPLYMKFYKRVNEIEINLISNSIEFHQGTGLKELVLGNSDKSNIQNQVRENGQLFEEHTDLLNLLEDLSLRIVLSNTIHREELLPIRKIFVQIVEVSAYMIFFHREIFTDKSVYNNLLKIYFEWKDKVDRETQDVKSEKFMKSIGN